MARLPFVHKRAALTGTRGAAEKYLRELVWRLRNTPTRGVCDAAAEVLASVAASGPRGWATAGLAPPQRPRNSPRDMRIWQAVADLHAKGGTKSAARERIAAREGLSASRVKAICLAWDRAQRETEADWRGPLRGGLKSSP